MKHELTIIMPENATLMSIEAVTRVIKRYADIITFEDDGTKRLAYPIQDNDMGRFMFWILDIDRDKVVKLSQALNINDHVLRYLLVRADSNYAK